MLSTQSTYPAPSRKTRKTDAMSSLSEHDTAMLRQAIEEPRRSREPVSDDDLYEALRGYWHPVACVSELTGGGPLAVTLLDEPLVLARIDGQVSAFRDVCVHRGTALSLGSVDENGLRCGYHGWCYDGEGRCTKIPARPDLKIPTRARLTAYSAAEHLGLIWVCLSGEPVYPLPENPYFGDESFRLIEVEPYNWNCALPRRIENYVDFGHFAWVHDGVLGDSAHPEVPDHSIGRHRNELRFEHPHMAEPPDSGKNKSLEIEGAVEVKLDYRLFMPNTILLDQYIESVDQRYLLFFSVCPTGRKTCRCFTFMGRDYAFDEATDKEMLDFNALVIGQDLKFVESQRPEELPVDLSAELQIAGVDRVAIEYRRWLREIAKGSNAARQAAGNDIDSRAPDPLRPVAEHF